MLIKTKRSKERVLAYSYSYVKSASYQRGGGVSRQDHSRNTGWYVFKIRGLWECHIESLIDVRFLASCAETYNKEGMDTILPRWGKPKKERNRRHCHNQGGGGVSVFLLSSWGARWGETSITYYFESAHGLKIEEPISHIKVWVKVIAIAVARSKSWILCVARVPIPLHTRYPEWE